MASAASNAAESAMSPRSTKTASAMSAGAASANAPIIHRAIGLLTPRLAPSAPAARHRSGGSSPAVLPDRLVRGERSQIDDVGDVGADLDDLCRPVEANEEWPHPLATAHLLEELRGDVGRVQPR